MVVAAATAVVAAATVVAAAAMGAAVAVTAAAAGADPAAVVAASAAPIADGATNSRLPKSSRPRKSAIPTINPQALRRLRVFFTTHHSPLTTLRHGVATCDAVM